MLAVTGSSIAYFFFNFNNIKRAGKAGPFRTMIPLIALI